MGHTVTDTIEVPVQAPTREWNLPAYNLKQFQTKIAYANTRLERAGLDARFVVTYEHYDVVRNVTAADRSVLANHASQHVTEPWVRATLDGPLTLSAGHFTFVARLIPEEAGVTVHSAPGQELGGYVPSGSDGCDHCGVDRNRTRLYLVRDERDGSILQLGHSCIELYTGVSPKGLWALEFDEDLREVSDSEGSFGVRDLGAGIDLVLAYAYAHSNQGRSYVATGGYTDTPTVDQVRTSLFTSLTNLRAEDRAYFEGKAAEAATYLGNAELLAAIKAAVATTDADSDYGRNLRVILAGEWVTGRNVGILASLVKIYAKHLQLEAERAANPIAAGFIGAVGQRLRDLELTLTTVRGIEGHYGETTLIIGRTGDGHVVKWFASGAHDVTVGQTLRLEAATVKDHEPYQGVDQTVVTRAKIDTFEERAHQALAAIDANGGSDTETVRRLTPHSYDDAGNFVPAVWEDQIDSIPARWFNKRELVRFAAWRAQQN